MYIDRIEEDGMQHHYAVCPDCDNPTQIIGLYRSDNRLQGTFLYRPKRRYAPWDRGVYQDQIAIEVLEGLIKHFDRVVYFLQQITGIRFSKRMLRSMLEDYRASQGYFYVGAMPINIPWIFAYMSGSQNLIGQSVNLKDLELLEALERDTTIQIVEKRIMPSDGIRFTTLNLFFMHHRKQYCGDENILSETVEMVISKNAQQTIFRREISFDHLSFRQLCSHTTFDSRPELIQLAQDVLGSLLPVA